MIEPDSVLRRAADVRYRLLEDEAVLICQKRAEAMGLNAVGGRFLDLCDGETGFAGVVDRVVAEFEVEREAAERDLRAFAIELVELGVLELAG